MKTKSLAIIALSLFATTAMARGYNHHNDNQYQYSHNQQSINEQIILEKLAKLEAIHNQELSRNKRRVAKQLVADIRNLLNPIQGLSREEFNQLLKRFKNESRYTRVDSINQTLEYRSLTGKQLLSLLRVNSQSYYKNIGKREVCRQQKQLVEHNLDNLSGNIDKQAILAEIHCQRIQTQVSDLLYQRG